MTWLTPNLASPSKSSKPKPSSKVTSGKFYCRISIRSRKKKGFATQLKKEQTAREAKEQEPQVRLQQELAQIESQHQSVSL